MNQIRVIQAINLAILPIEHILMTISFYQGVFMRFLVEILKLCMPWELLIAQGLKLFRAILVTFVVNILCTILVT